MELVRTAYGDKRLDKEGDLQKTVMKMTLRTSDTEVSEMYPDDAEAGVKLSMETVDWINWKQVFRSWMVANNYLDKFAPEVTELDTDGVTCVGISGGYIVTGHVSGTWSRVTVSHCPRVTRTRSRAWPWWMSCTRDPITEVSSTMFLCPGVVILTVVSWSLSYLTSSLGSWTRHRR